jgi:hypothetical protein
MLTSYASCANARNDSRLGALTAAAPNAADFNNPRRAMLGPNCKFLIMTLSQFVADDGWWHLPWLLPAARRWKFRFFRSGAIETLSLFQSPGIEDFYGPGDAKISARSHFAFENKLHVKIQSQRNYKIGCRRALEAIIPWSNPSNPGIGKPATMRDTL